MNAQPAQPGQFSFLRLVLIAVLAGCGLVPAMAGAAERPVMISIIIDDLGNQLLAGRRVIALDAPIACAVMPHTAHGARLAREANVAGKEVMLHLPMQPVDMQRIAGPGEISLDNDPSPEAIAAQFGQLLRQAERRGYAIGIGHPYPATLDFLEQALPALQAEGRIEIVPVSHIVQLLDDGDLRRERAVLASLR